MPYWSVYCVYCSGYLADALLECLPAAARSRWGYSQVFAARPGAALACPYCGGAFGFDDDGRPRRPESGWPVFRYGETELEIKKQADGEPAAVPLAEWALRHRFTRPGSHKPFAEYTYAEYAPADEVIP